MLDSRPATYVLTIIENIATVARWLAGLSGAGLTASAALMIAVYASLPGASNRCFASHFVSQTFSFARTSTLLFLIGGIAALIAARLPTIIAMWRNDARNRKLLDPLPLKKGLDGFTNRQANRVLMSQLVLIFISILVTLNHNAPMILAPTPPASRAPALHWQGSGFI